MNSRDCSGWLVALLAGALFASTPAKSRAAGASAPPGPDIRIEPGSFGLVNPADVHAVLQSAASQIARHCSGVWLPGISVYPRPDHPQMDLGRAPDGRLRIGISARDTRWAQYSFQFAHEFCHALANFGNDPTRAARYPNHATLWLEESLCETASLYTLHAMAQSWQDTPPYPAWKSYAPWFDTYATQRLALPRNHLPRGVAFPDWFRKNLPLLSRDAGRRDLNTIVATQLLPLFEAQPDGWRAIAWLNRDSDSDKASLPQHLASWRQAAPAELRPFIGKIARTLGVDLPRSTAR